MVLDLRREVCLRLRLVRDDKQECLGSWSAEGGTWRRITMKMGLRVNDGNQAVSITSPVATGEL